MWALVRGWLVWRLERVERGRNRLRDDNADRRSLAAMIVNELQIRECIPALYEAIRSTPETNEQVQFAQQALDALATFKPDGLAERVMEIAEDEKQHSMMRGRAFRVAIRLDDVPVEKLQGLLLRIVKNREANNILRNLAAGVLRVPRMAEIPARLGWLRVVRKRLS